jgi:hypothetical protein
MFAVLVALQIQIHVSDGKLKVDDADFRITQDKNVVRACREMDWTGPGPTLIAVMRVSSF